MAKRSDGASLMVKIGRTAAGSVLSDTHIVRIFCVVPMDSVFRLLRIEKLNLPSWAANQESMDAAPLGGRAK